MTCPTCNGSGEVHSRGTDPQTQEDYVCPDCGGTGAVDQFEPPTYFGPFDRVVTPNGAELFYRDDRHEYYRATKLEGDKWKGVGRLTGVSTAVKVFDTGSSDGLLTWAAKLECEGISTLVNGDGLPWPIPSGEALHEHLERNQQAWWQVRDRAATRGTNVHREALQALAEGKAVPSFDNLTPGEQGFAHGVVSFWMEHEPEPIHSECVVADLDLGVAGRFDLIYRSKLGALTLLDLKTTEKVPRKKDRPFYPVPHQVQLAGYDFLAGRSGYGRTVEQFVLYVDQDGDFELVQSHASEGDFKLALQVHRSAAAIRAARTAGQRAVRQGDLFTSTVEGAAAYERLHGGHP